MPDESDDDERLVQFGKVIAGLENFGKGIERIETALNTHISNTRGDIKDLHAKGDRAHDRIDEVKEEYAGDKGKQKGFLIAISLIWGAISAAFMKYIGKFLGE